MTDAIRYEKDQDNVVVLTMDIPGQSVSTVNGIYREAMAKTIARLEAEKEGTADMVLTPVKKTFLAGDDLNELIKVTKADAPIFYQGILELKDQLRRLETLGKPAVAAINGAALGSDWEICSACHHRIALDNPDVQLGLPEVTLGLLPGGGGVVCMVRLLGLEKALPCLAEGKKVRPTEAPKAGLIHELADSPEEMLEKARTWILANSMTKQPWDNAGYKIPGDTPVSPNVAQMLAIAPSVLRDKTKDCFSAPEKIICAVAEGVQVDFDTAQLIEARHFAELTTGQVTRNMIDTFWFQLNETNVDESRPQGYPVWATKEVGVIGAGIVGAGIAYVSTATGVKVMLKDVSLEAAGKGKVYSAKLLDKEVVRGHLSAEKRDTFLVRVMPSASEADFEGCDLIIEAVFEDRALKSKVTAEAEKHAPADAMAASNISTLPITGLTQAVARPEKFVGLHFFSSMDRIPLVEIIRDEKTSDETLAHGLGYMLQIKKTSVVVNDSRDFFTSRVLGTFTNEDIAMLGEDMSTAMIDNQAHQADMPAGPPAISNKVLLSLMTHIRNQTARDLEAEDKALPTHPAFTVIDLMASEYKRPGKAADAGFYDHLTNGRKHLWAGLKSHLEEPDARISVEDVRSYLLFIQAIEIMRCVEEGVLHSTADANIGSIFDIGFAAWSGNALQFINQYGLKDFIARAQYLAEQYGERFEPPTLLLEKMAKDELF